MPKAERAAQILFEAADDIAIDPNDLADDDYRDFDQFTIARVEPGRLWLQYYEDGVEHTIGPIPVPNKATRLLRKGWEISCALGSIRGTWRIIEVANVYPG